MLLHSLELDENSLIYILNFEQVRLSMRQFSTLIMKRVGCRVHFILKKSMIDTY